MQILIKLDINQHDGGTYTPHREVYSGPPYIQGGPLYTAPGRIMRTKIGSAVRVVKNEKSGNKLHKKMLETLRKINKQMVHKIRPECEMGFILWCIFGWGVIYN